MGLFDYSDYRSYLRSHIGKLPKNGRGEINRLAQFMSVHPSLVSQVLADTKNLNLEQAQQTCEYLGLTVHESEYFMNSVQLQRAGTVKLRDYFKKKLMTLKEEALEIHKRVRQDHTLTEEEKSIFYSHWLYAAVWLQTSLVGGQTFEEIVNFFDVPREKLMSIIRFLVETQLCILEKGRYVMGPQSIHLERGSVHLHKHHTNWRLRAIERNDKISNDELMYTGPLSLSRADLKKVRERLAEIIKEVTETAINSDAEEIVCFNIDLFKAK